MAAHSPATGLKPELPSPKSPRVQQQGSPRDAAIGTHGPVITQTGAVAALQLAALIHKKSAVQLSWLLNQTVKATWIKIAELD